MAFGNHNHNICLAKRHHGNSCLMGADWPSVVADLLLVRRLTCVLPVSLSTQVLKDLITVKNPKLRLFVCLISHFHFYGAW